LDGSQISIRFNTPLNSGERSFNTIEATSDRRYAMFQTIG